MTYTMIFFKKIFFWLDEAWKWKSLICDHFMLMIHDNFLSTYYVLDTELCSRAEKLTRMRVLKSLSFVIGTG